MAISDTAHDATKITRFFGPSTDTKPLRAMVDATFTETDTKREFFFDGVTWIRSALVTVEQAGAILLKDVEATNDLLREMLIELQISNAHLALINGDEINEEDIEDASN